MNTKQKFALEDFRSSINYLYGSIAGNLILFFLLAFPDFTSLWGNLHIQSCLVSALFFLLLRLFYHWKSQEVSFAFLAVYLLIVVLEYIGAGLPGYLVQYDFENYEVGKGIMMDIFIWALPAIYMAIRFFLGFPIISIMLQRRKVLKLTKVQIKTNS